MQKLISGKRRKKRKKEKVGSFRFFFFFFFFFFLRHFIIFRTRIDDFERCGGSPGQIFFRILAEKHFEKFFWVIFSDFLKKKFEDFWDKKVEISPQKKFLLHIKNFFGKEKYFLLQIYINSKLWNLNKKKSMQKKFWKQKKKERKKRKSG